METLAIRGYNNRFILYLTAAEIPEMDEYDIEHIISIYWLPKIFS